MGLVQCGRPQVWGYKVLLSAGVRDRIGLLLLRGGCCMAVKLALPAAAGCWD